MVSFKHFLGSLLTLALIASLLGFAPKAEAAGAEAYIYSQTLFISSGSSYGALYGLKTTVGGNPALPTGTKIVVEIYGCNGSNPTLRASRTINATSENAFSGTVSASVLGRNPSYRAHVITPDSRVASKAGRLGVAQDYLKSCDLSSKNAYKFFNGWNLEWKPNNVFVPVAVAPDTDKDGLSDQDEIALGTDPANPDSDFDNLNDGLEVSKYKSNPLVPDTDQDGLNDGAEVFTYKTNPVLQDTDSDTLSDYDEVTGTLNTAYGNQATSPLSADTDNDGVKDAQELSLGLNANARDTDGDSIIDGHEVTNQTNPLDALSPDETTDSDGDELPDRQEAQGVLNRYYNFEPTNPTLADSDFDGLSDDGEIIDWMTNPNLKDTDKDGLTDGEEVARRSDPLDRNDPVVQRVKNTWVKKWSKNISFNKRKTKASINATIISAVGKNYRAKASYVWKVKGKTVKKGRYVKLRKVWKRKNLTCVVTVTAPTYKAVSRKVIRRIPPR